MQMTLPVILAYAGDFIYTHAGQFTLADVAQLVEQLIRNQ